MKNYNPTTHPKKEEENRKERKQEDCMEVGGITAVQEQHWGGNILLFWFHYMNCLLHILSLNETNEKKIPLYYCELHSWCLYYASEKTRHSKVLGLRDLSTCPQCT